MKIASYFTNIRRYDRGVLIVKQGSSSSSFFVVLKGSVRVVMEGSRNALAEIGHNDFFGEIAYLTNTPRSASIFCKETCTLLELGENTLARLGITIREKLKDIITERIITRLGEQNAVLRAYRKKDEHRFTGAIEQYLGPTGNSVIDTEKNRQTILAYLNKIAFFTSFSAEEKRIIASSFTKVKHVKHATNIIEQGVRGQAFFVLLYGEATMVRERAFDDRVVMGHLKRGDIFGEIPFLTRQDYSSHVIANGECVLLKVDRDVLGQLGPETREKYKDAILNLLIHRLIQQNNTVQEYKTSVYFNL